MPDQTLLPATGSTDESQAPSDPAGDREAAVSAFQSRSVLLLERIHAIRKRSAGKIRSQRATRRKFNTAVCMVAGIAVADQYPITVRNSDALRMRNGYAPDALTAMPCRCALDTPQMPY